MTRAGVGNLLHLKSQIVTIRNPAGAAKLSSGPKTSVIPKMIPKKKVFIYLQKEPQLGVQRAQVADPWTWATKSRLRIVRKPNFRVIFQKAFNALFQIVVS